jgi:hypothetical protein
MDTSPEYDLMCATAQEIQGRWAYQRGDWWAFYDGEWMACCDTADNFIGFEGANGEAWLPRQDQLQELVGWGVDALVHDAARLLREEEWQCASMEELWLRIVMHEKHNKDWNGEAWVCAEKT